MVKTATRQTFRLLKRPHNKAQTDWIVNQKHYLMLFAIKIKCIYVNE